MEENEEKISKFSSGISILKRLDVLWKDTHKHSREGKFQGWNNDLDRVWLELARDLKPEEYLDLDKDRKIIIDKKDKDKINKKGFKSQFDEFDFELDKIMPFQDAGVSGFQQPSKGDTQNRNKQYKVLMEKQLFLARLENELGKGTSWGETEDDWD